jgi:hypothetical protein
MRRRWKSPFLCPCVNQRPPPGRTLEGVFYLVTSAAPMAAYLQHVGQLPQHPSLQQSALQQSVQQAGHFVQHLSPQQPAAEGAGDGAEPRDATSIMALRKIEDIG